MSYRLRNGEGLAAGIRRIAREQLEDALGEIATVAAGEEADAVHATRKDIKKLRALLRLIRAQIGPEIFQQENNRLREAARSFSGSRDACVQLQLLEQLREQAQQDGTAFTQTAAALQEEMSARADSFGPQRGEAEASLLSICDRLEGWPLEGLEIEELCCALRHSYKRARKCFRRAGAEPTPENFHAWRKRVKDIWYQARLLKRLNPAVMCEMIEDARTLGQHLGALHDLAFFRARLEVETDGPAGERTLLGGLICTREDELEEIALDLGARFFAEKAGALERRLLRYAGQWPARARSA